MRNLENFEEHVEFKDCEMGLDLYEANYVQHVESIAGDQWLFRVYRARKRLCQVQISFDESTGIIYEPFSSCSCGLSDCEHQAAALFKLREGFLGVKTDVEPLLATKECPRLGGAALRYAEAHVADAFANAKRTMHYQG
ncbi:MAG: hypothetical protein LBT59_08250 [Clostridiales bacterium]|nr:hypothetical protein [Clostridiales bacterium]